MGGHFRTVAAIALATSLVGCSTGGKLDVRARAEIVEATGFAQAMAKGHDLRGRGEFALAIDHYRRALQLQPNDAQALTALASCYDGIGRYDLGRRYHELALAAAPQSEDAVMEFARSLAKQGQIDAAASLIDDFRVAGPEATRAALAALAPAPRIAPPAPEPVVPPPSPAYPRLERRDQGVVALVTRDAPLQPAPRTMEAPRMAVVVPPPPVVTVAEPVAPAEAAIKVVSAAPEPAPLPAPVAAAIPRPKVVTVASAAPAPVRKPVGGLNQSAQNLVIRLDPPSPPRPALVVINAVGREGQAGRLSRYLAQRGWTARLRDSEQRLGTSQLRYAPAQEEHAQRLRRELPFPVTLVRARQPGVRLVLGFNALPFDDRLRRRRV